MRGIYLVGNYPDRETFLRSCAVVQECGFDFLEVGVPFNDPMADGKDIAERIGQVVRDGCTTLDVIDNLVLMRDIPLKKYVMTYANIVYSFGFGAFTDVLKSIINGIIIADLPNRHSSLFYDRGLGIPIIPFATLETRDGDMELINRSPGDFLYFVGLRGTTGSVTRLDSAEVEEKIRMIRSLTDKKIVFGFGIKGKREAERALSLCDGYVIGTEAVKRQDDPSRLGEYLRSVS